MDFSFVDLLNTSISASWLVLVVIVLRFLLKKAPKAIHCGLWALVAIRLLCPISIESEFSLMPSTEIVSDYYLTQEAASSSDQTVLEVVANPVYHQDVDMPLDLPAHRMEWSLFEWTALWPLGIAAMAVYMLISWLHLRKKVSASIPIARDIRLCDYIDSPFILGIFRPQIYLPSELEQKTIDHVLAHEKAHLARRDHWWKPLGFVLLTIHWFNPIMWLAYILLCRDIELACDEKVIRELNTEQKKAYSTALLRCSVSRPMIAACPLAFGEVGVKERVKTVLNYKKPAVWIIVLAIILCGVVAVCFLTDPVSQEENFLQPGSYVSQEKVFWSWYSSLCVEGMTMEVKDNAITLDMQAPSIDLAGSTFPLENDWQSECPINEPQRKTLAELSDIEPAFAIQDLSNCRFLPLDSTHFFVEKEGELYLVSWRSSNIHLEIIQYIFHMVPQTQSEETLTDGAYSQTEAIQKEIVSHNTVYSMEPHLTCASYIPIATAQGRGDDGAFEEILAAVRVATYYQNQAGTLRESYPQLFKALLRVREEGEYWTVTEYWQSNTQELTDLDWTISLPLTDLSEPTEYAADLEEACIQQARAYYGIEDTPVQSGDRIELGQATLDVEPAEEAIRQYFLERCETAGTFTAVSFVEHGSDYSWENNIAIDMGLFLSLRIAHYSQDTDGTIREDSFEMFPVQLQLALTGDGTYQITDCVRDSGDCSADAFALEVDCQIQANIHFSQASDKALAALKTNYPEYFSRDTTHGLDLLWWNTEDGVRCVIFSGLADYRERVGSEAGNHPPLTVAEAMLVLEYYDVPNSMIYGASNNFLSIYHVEQP